jgi:CheY-like chemotaxis protein
LLNLLSNAVKYNRDGGAVTIDVDTPGPGRVRIAVRDTGTGFTAEQMPRLFQPFERLGAERGNVEGVGIGLVVSKRLAELMGGTITVTSTHGVGSTFAVDFASASEAGHRAGRLRLAGNARHANRRERPPAPDRRTVLYIEDNPANLKLMTHMLQRRPQIELCTAPDGRIGLDLARTHDFDLILLDINLPGLDGYGVMSQLASDEATRSIPVVAVTANAMPADIQRGMAAGFRRYIAKPVDVHQLLRAMDELLGLQPAA